MIYIIRYRILFDNGHTKTYWHFDFNKKQQEQLYEESIELIKTIYREGITGYIRMGSRLVNLNKTSFVQVTKFW